MNLATDATSAFHRKALEWFTRGGFVPQISLSPGGLERLRLEATLHETVDSARGRAVGRVIAALMVEGTLPGPGDVSALIPPTREAFVRRVPDRNLWIWYVEVGAELWLLGLTSEPPTPIG